MATGVDFSQEYHTQASNCGAFPDIPVCEAGLGPLPALVSQVMCSLVPPEQPGPTSSPYCPSLPEMGSNSSVPTGNG